MVSALEHGGVQLSWREVLPPQNPLESQFWDIVGLVQADRIWSPQDLMGVQLWDIVGFSRV